MRKNLASMPKLRLKKQLLKKRQITKAAAQLKVAVQLLKKKQLNKL